MLKRVGTSEKKTGVGAKGTQSQRKAGAHMSFHSIPFSIIQLHCTSLHCITQSN